MRRNTVVPDDNRVLLPLQAGLQIRAEGDVLVEEVEEVVRLLLLQADDAARELGVDEERFLARDGVGAHERVDGGDGLAAHDGASRQSGVGLLVP